MTTQKKIAVFALRVSVGWYMFYAGITKVLDPAWSAEGYIKSAKSFVWLYELFLHPTIVPIVNVLNAWGLTLLGVSLMVGLFVRWSTVPGALLMLLYYGVALDFPHPDAHSYIVDQHIIYAGVLLLFYAFRVGEIWGLDHVLPRKK